MGSFEGSHSLHPTFAGPGNEGHERPQSSRRMTRPRIVEAQARLFGQPFFKDAREPSRGDVVLDVQPRQIGVARSRKSRLIRQAGIVERQDAAHVDCATLTRADKFPDVDRAASQSKSDTWRAEQILWLSWESMGSNDRRGGDDRIA